MKTEELSNRWMLIAFKKKMVLSTHVRLYLSIITVPKSSATVVTVRTPTIPETLEDPFGKKML